MSNFSMTRTVKNPPKMPKQQKMKWLCKWCFGVICEYDVASQFSLYIGHVNPLPPEHERPHLCKTCENEKKQWKHLVDKLPDWEDAVWKANFTEEEIEKYR